MSHTPGPWRIAVFRDSDEWDEETMALKEDKNVVLRIEGKNGKHVCGTCDGCNSITGEDARLIVAAPELLKLVTQFKEATAPLSHQPHCGKYANRSERCSCGLSDVGDCWDAARTLLDKIRGES